MWDYDRKLMYPVKIKNPNPALAKMVIAQYGGASQNVRVTYLTPPKYTF